MQGTVCNVGESIALQTWPLEKYTIAQHDMVTDSTSTFTHVQAVLIMPPMEVLTGLDVVSADIV